MYKRVASICFVQCAESFESAIRSMLPLPGFTHIFTKDAGRADLIFAGSMLSDEQLESLGKNRKKSAGIIFLRQERRQLPIVVMAELSDIWELPLAGDDLRFRFRRWQEGHKQGKELGQANSFLESLINTSPNLIWFKSKNGIHELVNAAFCECTNKTREQIQGRGHAYIWDVEREDPACIESERIAMESGRMHISEEEISTGSGRRQLTVYKSPVPGDDGSMLGTVGVGIDVTAERLYRQKLLQSRAALEAVYTSMDCGILLHSLDGKRIISINDVALKLLGYASKSDIEANFDMIVGNVMEEDKPRLRKSILQLTNVGDSCSYEYRVMHADRKFLHLMGTAKLVEKDGEVLCQRFILDCTARKLEEEKEQSEREKRQKELVRALSTDFQLVCVLGEDGGTGQILRVLDYPDNKLPKIFTGDAPLTARFSAYIDSCVHPDDRELCRQAFAFGALRERLMTDDIYYFNYRALNGDDVLYFQLKAVRVGEPGGPHGIVLGLKSVDARTRYELEQKNILAGALKQAQQANNAKSIFLSNMSHDIRTPMNAVLGYANLALNHVGQDSAVSGYLNRILDSGSHLVSLINDILDMSHIESGKIQIEKNPCNLPKLLDKIINIVKPEAIRKTQTLILETKDLRHPDVYCDELRLRQIILNILGNSIKYTGQKGEITVRMREMDSAVPGNASYELRIADNGIGMSEQFLQHIFEPFERAQTPATAGIQGTGLGMTITKSLVEMMEGRIEVNSRLNEGSEFILQFLFGIHEAAPGATVDKPLAPTAAPVKMKRSGRLLLVEDNAMNREIAYEFLAGAGYSVDVADNGEKAVEIVADSQAGHYDLVLMDVQMPVMDGYAATAKIRALESKALAEIPIIAMTANSFEEDRQAALNCGMNAHIAKPIDFHSLFRLLDSFLGQDDVADGDVDNEAAAS